MQGLKSEFASGFEIIYMPKVDTWCFHPTAKLSGIKGIKKKVKRIIMYF
jgi:hypothetical protein